MKVLFFASFREFLDADSETWDDLSNIKTVEDVLSRLHERGDKWQQVLEPGRLLVSINQEMADISSPVSANDEVAFMPPVTGG